MRTDIVRPGIHNADYILEFRSSMQAFLLKSFTGWIVIVMTVALMGVPLIVLAYLALKYRMTHYELSGDRLFMRHGIINRTEEEIELYRIKDVRADFSIIQQFFDVADLQIVSSDTTGNSNGRRSVCRIPHVPHAREIRSELRDRSEAARKAKGVREFDT